MASYRVPVVAPDGNARVLVLDDHGGVRELLSALLEAAGLEPSTAATIDEARALLAAEPFALCLCDLELPQGSGFELLAESAGTDAAFVVVTGHDDLGLAARSLELGAYGYIVKPFRQSEVLIAVQNALHRRRLEREARHHREELERRVLRATRELRFAKTESIRRLARAVELRDEGTGQHVDRMGAYCGLVARRLGLGNARAARIRTASLLHDVGKIGVPDRILLKPGALTARERATMERHAEFGHRLLADSRSELLQLAASIALTHHERHDGSGYPQGLARDDIPVEGRIAAVCDVFDALTSVRPYRGEPYSLEEASTMVREGRGSQFDPDVVDALLGARADVAKIHGSRRRAAPLRSAGPARRRRAVGQAIDTGVRPPGGRREHARAHGRRAPRAQP